MQGMACLAFSVPQAAALPESLNSHPHTTLKDCCCVAIPVIALLVTVEQQLLSPTHRGSVIVTAVF